jgi:cell wall-associated NlpC family hydrolase
MSSSTGHSRRASLASTARRTGIVLALAAAFAAAAAGPANAGRIADKKAQIAQVQRELDSSNQKLEAAIEAYNGARSELTQVEAEIKRNTQRLKIARSNLKAAKANLATFLVSAYKGGSQDAFFVLGSGSFSDLLDRMDYVRRMSKAEGQLVDEVRTAEHEISVRQAQLKAAEKKAKTLVAQTSARKSAVAAELHAREQLLGGLKGDLRTLIAQRQAHLDAVAKARAAALAEAQQQAAASSAGSSSTTTTTTSTGSSGDGGGSSSTGGGCWSPPPAGPLGQQAVAIAQRYLGVPYVWGGASPSGFDCSGLTMYVYAQLGIHLDHYTGSQWGAGPHVSMSQLMPGDLVFFYSGHDHVGIYMGGGLFIHAPHTGDVVKISSLSGYYAGVFAGAVRVA